MSSNGEKCSCDKIEGTPESDSSNSDTSTPKEVKEKKTKISLTSLGINLRRGRSLQFKTKRSKKNSTNISGEPSTSSSNSTSSNKKISKWPLKFYHGKKAPKVVHSENQTCCKCTCYRRTDEHHLGAGVVFTDESDLNNDNVQESIPESVPAESEEISTVQDTENTTPVETEQTDTVTSNRNALQILFSSPFIDMQWLRFVHEDREEMARLQRAREIEQGVEPPPSFRPLRRVQLLCSDIESEAQIPRRLQLVVPPDLTDDSLRALFQNNVTFRSCPLDFITGCHTQVDFIHCLVPDLLDITNCSFYWGKMDRYEAERLLDGKREGTFLLRDSAQEEFLFSVSFRKYGRSLHARIEQWNHKFSFDSHDPGVYTSETVCGLIEHYKDPSSCMFFEPMLTWPLHRNFVFSLQHLSRATIVSHLTYDNVNQLQLPKSLKSYLKEYHYRQKVRVERFDDDVNWLDLRQSPT